MPTRTAKLYGVNVSPPASAVNLTMQDKQVANTTVNHVPRTREVGDAGFQPAHPSHLQYLAIGGGLSAHNRQLQVGGTHPRPTGLAGAEKQSGAAGWSGNGTAKPVWGAINTTSPHTM